MHRNLRMSTGGDRRKAWPPHVLAEALMNIVTSKEDIPFPTVVGKEVNISQESI